MVKQNLGMNRFFILKSSEIAKSVTLNEALETVTIEFNQEFKPGFDLVLSISFTGIHNDKMAGFYRSGYTVNGEKRYVVFHLKILIQCLYVDTWL